MTSKKIWLLALLAAIAGTSAHAEVESETLFHEGAWSVDINHDTDDGSLFCDAYVGNDDGQLLQIIATDGGEIALSVWDPTWSVAERPVRFLVDVDYERWTIEGFASGSNVVASLVGTDNVGRFFGELGQGTAVAVYSANVRRLATFSLLGSRAALNELASCWSRIEPKDPFTTASDPF